MNHISKMFAQGGGRAHRGHSWEQREGGYRRIALLVGNGIWPANKEKRLVSFLLDRGFCVLSLDLALGSPAAPRVRLRAFRHAISAFAKAEAPSGLPLYLIASSFSASALMPVANEIEGITALALVSPIVEFPLPRLKFPFFFLPTAQIPAGPERLSGSPELLEGLADGASVLKFHRRDLKTLAADIARSLDKPQTVPAAAFAGEDDPFLSQEGIKALSKAGLKVYSYPRVKHEPGHDRYADNFYADLGSFLDEVEAGKVPAR